MASKDKQFDLETSPKHVTPTFLGLPIFKINVALRILFFVFSLVAAVIVVTSKQTKHIYVPSIQMTITKSAKFNEIPAHVYFVVSMFVASLYGLITILASVVAAVKPDFYNKIRLHLVLWDVVILAIVAAAISGAGTVGYIGYNGNSHIGWQEVCSTYDKFCEKLLTAFCFAAVPAITLVVLIMLSFILLTKKT